MSHVTTRGQATAPSGPQPGSVIPLPEPDDEDVDFGSDCDIGHSDICQGRKKGEDVGLGEGCVRD